MLQLAKSLFLILPCLTLLAGAGLCQEDDSGTTDTLPGPDDFVPVDTVVEMIYYETPEFPFAAVKNMWEGTVWIKALIGSDGLVRDAIVYRTSGHKELDESALKASFKCRFNPAIRDGRPVATWATYKVKFEQHEVDHTQKKPPKPWKPKGYRCKIDTILQVLPEKSSPDMARIDTSGEKQRGVSLRTFGILMFHQSWVERSSSWFERQAHVLIDGGRADGLTVGMKGTVSALGPDDITKTLATVTITDVQPSESMCEVMVGAGSTVTKYDCVQFEVSPISEDVHLERALDAYSKGELELALAHFEKIAHRAESNPMIANRLAQCREAVMSPSSSLLPDERESLEKVVPANLAIADEYVRLGNRNGAQRYLSKVLAVDSKNRGATGTLAAMKALEDCDSIAGRSPEALSPPPKMHVYTVPEGPVDIESSRSHFSVDLRKKDYKYHGGEVGIEALIGRWGEILALEVARSSGDEVLDRTAYEAAFNSRFSPAIRCGRPEPVWVSWDFSFRKR